MKLNKLLLATLCMGTFMASCNLETDDEDNYMTGTYPCCNLVIPDAGDAFATNATYNMAFYYISGNVSVSTSNLSLGYGNFAFTTNIMPCETKLYDVNGSTLDVTTFGTGSADMNGVLVQNLKGYVSSIVNGLSTNDPVTPLYKFTLRVPPVLSYKVNHDYTVKTFMPDAIYTGQTSISTMGSSDAPFTSKDIKYRVVFANDLKTADVIFYNAKFAEMMPITINFVLKDLDVKYTKNGYTISGTNLVPYMLEGNSLTEYPNYTFTSFNFTNTSPDLTVGAADYVVMNRYAGSFQGYYVMNPEDSKN